MEYWLQQGWWNASLYIFCFQTFTWNCTQELYSPNHMFKVNKQLLSPTSMHMTWQNIPCHVMEYFSISPKIFHMENEYNKNIPSHGMEYFWRFCPHLLISLEILYGHMVVETMGVLALFYHFWNTLQLHVFTICWP